MFEWDDARYFLAVHRTATLSAAGRQLKVNQSTVGRRIRALEEALGARLFVQTPEGYFVAEAGERLLPRVTRMEEEALALEREASGQDTCLTGTVRVTGADTFGARVIAPLLAELHRRAPGIDFELVADNRTLSLTKREADMAIRTARPREASVVARRICDFASSLYATKAYLDAHGKPEGGDYAGHALISVDDPSWAESLWVARNASSARVVFKTNNTSAQLAATLEGIGIGILPCYVGDAEPRLARLLPPDKCAVRELWLALHRDLAHSARIRMCADFLVEKIGARSAEFAGTPKRGKGKAR